MTNVFNILLTQGETYNCGMNFSFDGILPNIVSYIVALIQIGVPILLIVFGMIDLGKAVMAQKDDEIKKGQQTFFKRLIAAVIVFFIVAIAKLVFSVVGINPGYMKCVNCFITAQSGGESACVEGEGTANQP